MQTLIALVASGFGIALIPASLASAPRDDIVFRPISVDAPDELRHLDLLMGWNSEKISPVRDRLIDEIRRNMITGQQIETLNISY
jgi:DNA-binding transcriptional LysR family regulator